MKRIIYTPLYFFLSCVCFATSYLPEEKPKIELKEALRIAEDFFEKNKEEQEGYYISRVECLYLKDADERSWLIGWASPKSGWYFLAVHMNGKIEVNPKQWTRPIPEIVIVPVIDLKSNPDKVQPGEIVNASAADEIPDN